MTGLSLGTLWSEYRVTIISLLDLALAMNGIGGELDAEDTTKLAEVSKRRWELEHAITQRIEEIEHG